MAKRVLIVTYYWPPAGGPGVQRWLKFVKYLPEHDIEPIVYCPSNANYPIIDKSLKAEIPENISILKQPIKEPYKLANLFSKQTKTISKGIIKEKDKQSLPERLMLFIRGNFFIPDARKQWVKPSTNFLTTYIQDFNIDTVITTGPPHSLHLIGLKIKQKLEVNWIADFRDPWTTIGYHKQLKLTNFAKKQHKQLESKVLNQADQIVVTSPSTKTEFEAITNKPITVITNGYDQEKVEVNNLDEKFTLSHIGSLLSKRNPEILWQALSEIINNNDDFKRCFQLNLVGEVGEDIINSLGKYNLIDYLNKTGYVSHNEAVKFQKKSQVLLLIEINSEDTKAIIPGKLFEYMVSNRPILAIGPKGADISKLITETNTGKFFNYSEYDALKSEILNMFEAYQNKTLNVNAIGLQKYSRKALTKQLVDLINNL
ncbi:MULTISPECIES: glycosyltransferase family 4 protein [Mesoflavibacter]|uniref:Glycosyltransferase family 4 protein n=1 Tax=Mesoflavibacter profundi TaxID=2708110 RepID=A0ABT4RY00_9FLAO|nr:MULTISPECIES: glycosyltransferase family 4 protein [Mesoflavibacter]MDA0176700.1 glycosyltransferase family 4 protein [Mesoflavibacter profundi]QIJ90357.1 TPR/glycosyl transferase domain protein [Mesoflavibacter sp. HG96]QIJ93085.1 TPR/glycosyl transferase domain protein [Mesoflavibacter sp. HG37]